LPSKFAGEAFISLMGVALMELQPLSKIPATAAAITIPAM
jgi:hypothetical protein